MNRTYNYVRERNRTDRRNICTSVKGTEKIAKDRNYSIRTERISVDSRTERTNVCVTKIFLYEARANKISLLSRRVSE